MKKMMALAMAAVMTMAALTGCGGSSDSASGDVPVIGISQYGQHASLDNCREGFLLGLEEIRTQVSMIPSHSRSLRTSPQTT